MEDPWRPVGIELADGDLMQEIGEARRIGRIWAGPPDLADASAQGVGQRKEPGTAFPPPGSALIATVAFVLVPPDGAASHFLVGAMLRGGDVVGKERQGLAFEPLLAVERRALA